MRKFLRIIRVYKSANERTNERTVLLLLVSLSWNKRGDVSTDSASYDASNYEKRGRGGEIVITGNADNIPGESMI